MAKEATTIYIDDSAISVLVAKVRKVQKWASMPLESGLVKGGVILEEDAVASKVRELWQNEKIGASRVIAGISGINCLYRLLTLPELPKDILPEAVRREAGRVLGVPLEQLYLSWQTLPSLRGETLIYLTASPRNSVDALISTLHKAGLNPYLMDLRPLALARATTEPGAIIIDLQPASFDIVVITGGIPQVIRSLPLAQEASMEKKMRIVKEELDRAITFYNSSHMDRPIGAAAPLLVSGELAEQPDTWEFLKGRQECSIQPLPSPIEVAEDFPASQYMTNIGLALKELTPGKAAISIIDFNILPRAYQPKARPVSEILFIPVIIAGIALVVFGVFFNSTASRHTDALRSELANINQMVISQQVQVKETLALNEEASSLEETVAAFTTTLDDFKTGRGEVNGDLAEINSCLLGGIKDSPLSISDDGDNIKVTGLASNENAVFSYAKDLRDSKRFVLVVISKMDKLKDKPGMGFTLTLTK
jgi:type IV pilus assembly protein PilM